MRSFGKFDEEMYKNIDKSTSLVYEEKEAFKVLTFTNTTDVSLLLKYQLKQNYLGFYFVVNEAASVAFNMPHCAVPIPAEHCCFSYVKEEEMTLLFDLKPSSTMVVVLFTVTYFHSLFSTDNLGVFNFDNLKLGKPIIDTKATGVAEKMVLHQLLNNSMNASIKPLFVKGKVFELLSLYYNVSNQQEDSCPYIANEDTVLKIKKAKDIIIENMSNPPSLDELSKAVGLNVKKLKQGFKDYYGAPVYTFLLNYKMEKAKEFLAIENTNVNEVGVRLGYSTSSHFIAAFKKKYGTTPKQYILSL